MDKAMELEAVGGTFGGILEPTTFICLMLKMLQARASLGPCLGLGLGSRRP